MVGYFRWQKDQLTVIKSFESLVQKYPQIELHLIGHPVSENYNLCINYIQGI